MPTLHVGLDFDNLVYTPRDADLTGALYAGPKKLLHWLESQLGLSGAPENTEYLRIELYRQALLQWAESASAPCFFEESFQADRFATAAALLNWRDDLVLAGWDFRPGSDCPTRLADFAGLESVFLKKINNPELGASAYGFADRCARVFDWLPLRQLPVEKIILYEPLELQPPFVRRLISHFRAQQIPLETVAHQGGATNPNSDLAWLQGHFSGRHSGKKTASNDGSLLVLTARRDSDAAVFLAQWLAKKPDRQPVFLIPELNRVLEQALIQEGFPAIGVLSASLARPSLQVLKLAPAFLWEPVDVFKIMEFVTLPLKPLDDGLALEIARVLAQKPGLFSDNWFAAVLGYLDREQTAESVREQYEFWFSRRRYRADALAPKRDVIDLYAYLHRWALELFNETENTSLLVLAEQARRIRELLEALPEERLGFLELERIVRTIYEPAPVQLMPAETGHFEYVHQPGALAAPADMLVWWNCLFDGAVAAPDRWHQTERDWLAAHGVHPDDPQLEGSRKLLLAQRPVLQAAERLVLVVPEQAGGAAVLPSLLLSDIEAVFGNHHSFCYCIDEAEALSRLEQVPEPVFLECHPTVRPRPQLNIPASERLPESAYETPTNLDRLFYYPHRWFFRQKLRFFPISLLEVTRDQTLLGNLAHRFFELFLQEKDCLEWDKNHLFAWLDQKAGALLEREGATLLLYGREPERNQFLNRVKQAAWSLLTLIRSNGWSVFGTEMVLEGEIGGCLVKGKADLVLHRNGDERAIIDLKWSGARRRKEMIQNGEDLQLILYAKLLDPPDQWAHTAYFILNDGKMIARNKDAFSDAVAAQGIWDNHVNACEAIFARMERTFSWRMEQVQKGLVEIRTARTAPELEALYGPELLELLEMKTEDAWWDEYKTLLGI